MNKLRTDIIDICNGMNNDGLNQGTSGNVSCRDGLGILITPSGVPYETTRQFTQTVRHHAQTPPASHVGEAAMPFSPSRASSFD